MMYAVDLAQPLTCSMFGRMMQENGWHRRYLHKNTNHLLVFVISGTADFQVGEEKLTVCAGDVLFIPADTSYAANTNDQCEYYFFRFSARVAVLNAAPDYPDIGRTVSFMIPRVPHRTVAIAQKTSLQEDYQKFYQSIISCVEYNTSLTLSGRLLLDIELQKILLILSQIQERKTDTSAFPLVLTQMIEYVRKNLTKPITTATLCSYCGVSKSYAARLFRKYLNTTVTKYITGEKLYYACELMNSTGMNISQIASYLGFCDVFYFSKCFKEKFGKSPMQMIPRE